MENIIEQENLKEMYNILDWIDLGLIGVISFYYIALWNRLQYDLPIGLELDFGQIINLIIENTKLVGIVLLLVSLAVSSAFVYLTVRMRKTGCISGVRAGVRLIWNGTFILMDIFVLFMILIYRIFG